MNTHRLLDRMQSDELGDEIIAALSEVFKDQASTVALKAWLSNEIKRLSSRDKIKTDAEEIVMMILEKSPSKVLGLQDVCEKAKDYDLRSLQKLGYASKVVNTLAAKGIIGKWRVNEGRGRPKTQFGDPKRAIMAILTQKNISLSEAGKADEVMLELADITGMPLANIVGILVESPSPR
jgi:L-cysteine desulfidase